MPISATDLNKAYLAYFGRPVDFTGKTHFANLELADVIKAFDSSAESQALYGSDVAAKVNAIYNNLFNRDAEPAGLLHWSTLIGQGRITAAEAAFKIMEGALGSDVTAVQNKLSASEAFAAELNTTAELLGYSGMAAAAAARAFLKTVDATPASLTAAVAAVAATVATVAASGGPAGQTFTLTAGAENVTGTSGNDTINALAVKADGAAATTFSAFDNVDGGAGTDTLNIYTTAAENTAFATAATVKNVEVVNIYNTAAAAAFGDASKFEGATQLWQHAASTNVTKLAATTTAGFKGLTLSANADQAGVNTTATARSVSAADAATSVAVALDGVKGDAATAIAVAAGVAVQGLNATTQNQAALNLSGAALTAVTVSGTLAQATTTAGAAAASLALGVTAGKDVETLTVNTAVATTLTVTENGTSAASKDIRTLDASASAGAVTFGGSVTGGTAGSLATIKTGAGADTVTIATATLKDDAATTTVNEAVSALVETGAGNDKVTINTTGTGTTNVEAGEGNDTVTLTADGSGILTVNLGAGNDTFKGAGAVSATDVINAGDGTDTLLLNMVGAANIGAFSNFETFDAVGINKTLDVEILAAKNTVTEFVMSGDNGGTAALTNIGAGVGFRVTGDTTFTNVTTLTQKTAGALTITLDIDETGTTAATTAATNRDVAVTASNATSIKAVFDSAFVAAATGAGDNATDLNITGTAATTLEVVSGGANALNELDYTTASASGKSVLTSVTVSGDRALDLDLAITGGGTNEVATINASALTGALTFALDDLKAAGTLSLGSGDDVITVQTGVAADVATIIGAHRKVAGVEKGSAEDLTAISNYDVFKLTGAIQAVDNTTGTADASVKDGKVTFKGAGPATLDKAVEFAQALISANEAAVFEYVGKSFIFAEGATNDAGDDVLIELTGVTGLNGLDVVNSAAGTLYVF